MKHFKTLRKHLQYAHYVQSTQTQRNLTQIKMLLQRLGSRAKAFESLQLHLFYSQPKPSLELLFPL